MIEDKKVLAIIPARGGSKGLPRKNIKPLLGKPLIVWTIEQAINCNYIDKIIVSSEDEEILKVAELHGSEIIKRPFELAKDDTPTSEVILHVLENLEKKLDFYDIIVLLEPTSPLRKKTDLNLSIEKFLALYDKADSLISLGKIHLENPYLCKIIEGELIKPLIHTEIELYQRQQYPETYFPYGVIYIVKTDVFKKTKTFYNEKTTYHLIERWQNYEIDDIFDFICVEAILKEKIKEII